MKIKMFGPTDPFTILNFLATFKHACASYGIHEGAALWWIKHFIIKLAAISSQCRPQLKNKKSSDKLEGMLFSWSKVGNHYLETRPTSNSDAEAKMKFENFKMPPNVTPSQNAGALWTRALRCSQGNMQHTLKGLYIEGLSDSIGSIMHSFWCYNESSTLCDL